MKIFFTASLFVFYSINSSALTVEQAGGAIHTATMRVNSSEYESAFNEMGWMLSYKSVEIQKLATDFLEKYPVVANSKLNSFTDERIREISCQSGDAEKSKMEIDKQINNLSPYADDKIKLEVANRVSAFFSNAENLDKISKCRMKNSDIDNDGKKNRADLVDKLTKRAPIILGSMELEELCVKYGRIVQGHYLEDFSLINNPSQFFEAELKKRRVNINKQLIKDAQIRIGINQCTLYASWGLPNSKNRSVGSWGVHVQNVYRDSGAYIYTENGKVTSWQKTNAN